MQEFKCLAANCPDTCCKVWKMQVDAQTIDLYKKDAPELLESTEFDELTKNTVMKRDGGRGFCVKFSNGICGIHKDFGENFLGDACYFYPRVTRKLGDKVFMSASLSCPETVRLAVIEKKSGWVEGETERIPVSLKGYSDDDISAALVLSLSKLLEESSDGITGKSSFLLELGQKLDGFEKADWHLNIPEKIVYERGPINIAPTEIYKILNTFAVLVYGAKMKVSGRLQEVVEVAQKALGVIIDFDNARIISGINGARNLEEVKREFQKNSPEFEGVLNGYLMASLEFSLFPFAGLGRSVFEKAAITIFRLALVRVFILSTAMARPLADDDIVKIIQSISRVIDHLEGEELLLKIFEDNGWKTSRDFEGLVAV